VERLKGSGLITPSKEIIGKNKEFNPVEAATTKIELDQPEQYNYDEHRKYNTEINNHPELIDKLHIRDGYVLIRLFKYDKESKSEGGIILEDVELYETHGGQKRARIKDTPFQRRGVIVKTGVLNSSEEWKSLMIPGNIVHIPENKLKEYHLDKSKKVDIGHGYFMMNAAVIEALETA
jgi:hypothetical protein